MARGSGAHAIRVMRKDGDGVEQEADQLACFGFAVFVDQCPVLETVRVNASPFEVHCSPKLRGLPAEVDLVGRGGPWTPLAFLVVIDRVLLPRDRVIGTG